MSVGGETRRPETRGAMARFDGCILMRCAYERQGNSKQFVARFVSLRLGWKRGVFHRLLRPLGLIARVSLIETPRQFVSRRWIDALQVRAIHWL